MINRDRLAWLVIAGGGLTAMVAGHAFELWLERLHAFGGTAASYAHAAQSPAIQTALAFFVIAMLGAGGRVLALAGRSSTSDCFLPALQGVARAGLTKVSAGLLGVQFASLTVAEFCEQRASGFHGNGLAAVIGHGHATALPVHLLVGLALAFALQRFARYASARAGAIVNAVAVFLRRVGTRPTWAPRASRFRLALHFSGQRPCLLALGLANRPPPLV